MTKDQFFTSVLEQLFTQHKRKHDIYYKEGHGALITPEGYPLEQRFVVAVISEVQIQMATSGINFRF